MLLKASPAFSLLKNPQVETRVPLFSRNGSGFGSGAVVVCATKGANNKPLTGVIFEPFEEVKKELNLVPTVPQMSLARQKFADECEAAINEQINVEYNVSYVYHAMYAYFDRDNVALKGLAKFFKESSLEEREHAEKLMEYQNKRGGQVKLQSILMPCSEFDHAEKGDALYGEFKLLEPHITSSLCIHKNKMCIEKCDSKMLLIPKALCLSLLLQLFKCQFLGLLSKALLKGALHAESPLFSIVFAVENCDWKMLLKNI
ncbi:hypothetical protein Goari_003665 [Gossypium aridum]|uniref:Ferritin n=1 Tax=Gossypium aridum TaxID=34290 RepID=A0A7J8YC60_GOSAI|nr:hypothetical protein [Gossypium aridum]